MRTEYIIAGVVIVVLIGAVALIGMNPDSSASDQTESEASQTDNSNSVNDSTMSQKNIVETAIDTPDLSTLVAAVQAGELVDTLSDSGSMLTVFAPTNEAFAAIQPTVDQLLMPDNKSDLQNVLQYHVVAGKVMSGSLEDGMVVTALNGDELEIRIDNDKVYINDAQVVIADVETSNGVVHVINQVLVP